MPSTALVPAFAVAAALVTAGRRSPLADLATCMTVPVIPLTVVSALLNIVSAPVDIAMRLVPAVRLARVPAVASPLRINDDAWVLGYVVLGDIFVDRAMGFA